MSNSIDQANFKNIEGLAFDIDDTFSTDGKITAEAFSALWKLKKNGFSAVAITGRPAGWCDHIARFWPVDAVVGENGAFCFFMKDGFRKRFDFEVPKQKELLKLKSEIERAFKGVQFASDQPYREFDLAIDFCEDVKRWDMQTVLKLKAFCEARGAKAKISSVHVNTWYGNFDKSSGFKGLLQKSGLSLPAFEKWIFVGDSPNDEPLFRNFNVSVGVKNIDSFLNQLKSKPTYITNNKSGAGFVELVNALISAKD